MRKIGWFLIYTLLISTGIFLQFHYIFNSDNGWLVQMAQLMLHGKKYYYDFLEVNPPLILFLNMPVVLLANWLKISLFHSFIASVSLLSTTIIILMSYLLKKITHDVLFNRTIILCLIYLLFLYYGPLFGEREYLTFVLIIPYLFLLNLRLLKKTPPFFIVLLISVLSAIGFLIKPFFLLPFLMTELFYYYKNRSLKPMLRTETLAFLVIILLYLASILYVTPEYIEKVIPFAHRYYYAGYNFFDLPLLLTIPNVFYSFTVVFYFLFRKTLEKRTLLDLLFTPAAGFFAIFIFERQPWAYHLFPCSCLLVILAAVMLVDFIKAGHQKNKWLIILLSIFLASHLLAPIKLIPKFSASRFADVKTAAQKLFQHSSDKTFFSLSSEMLYGNTLVSLGATRIQRYPNIIYLLHPVYETYNHAKNPQEKKIALQKINSIINYMLHSLRKKPKYIFVQYLDTQCIEKHQPAILKNLLKNRAFKKVFSDYHFVQNIKINHIMTGENTAAVYERN